MPLRKDPKAFQVPRYGGMDWVFHFGAVVHFVSFFLSYFAADAEAAEAAEAAATSSQVLA